MYGEGADCRYSLLEGADDVRNRIRIEVIDLHGGFNPASEIAIRPWSIQFWPERERRQFAGIGVLYAAAQFPSWARHIGRSNGYGEMPRVLIGGLVLRVAPDLDDEESLIPFVTGDEDGISLTTRRRVHHYHRVVIPKMWK